MDDQALRKNVVELLEGGHAHAGPKSLLSDLNPKLCNTRPPGFAHTAWELLEHMRLAQEDILHYTLDPKWESPPFPEGYWPPAAQRATPKMWSNSVARFLKDLREVVKLARNRKIDLTALVPHGEGRTYLRQLLLVADHNAYHLGQILDVRRALGDWEH
jgi:hypothetical protein